MLQTGSHFDPDVLNRMKERISTFEKERTDIVIEKGVLKGNVLKEVNSNTVKRGLKDFQKRRFWKPPNKRSFTNVVWMSFNDAFRNR